jgi:hypothetical protein
MINHFLISLPLNSMSEIEHVFFNLFGKNQVECGTAEHLPEFGFWFSILSAHESHMGILN